MNYYLLEQAKSLLLRWCSNNLDVLAIRALERESTYVCGLICEEYDKKPEGQVSNDESEMEVVQAALNVLQWADAEGDFVEGPAVRRDVAEARRLIAEYMANVPVGPVEPAQPAIKT